MYPLRVDTLRLGEIAHHWAQEPAQGASSDELKLLLFRAWLSGDLKATLPGSRKEPWRPRHVIEWLLRKKALRIDKTGDGKDTDVYPQEDGSVELVFLAPRVVVSAPEWSDADWEEASKQLADKWDQVDADQKQLMTPWINGLLIKHDDFADYHERQKFHEQTFWASTAPAKQLSKAKTRVDTAEALARKERLIVWRDTKWPDPANRPNASRIATKLINAKLNEGLKHQAVRKIFRD